MKTFLLTLSLAVAGIAPTYAQPSSAARGAVVGSIAGALIGGHNHDRWAAGAVIGAAAGALLGTAVDQPRTVVVTAAPPVVGVYVPMRPEVVYVGTPTPPVRVVYVNRPAPVVVVRGHPYRASRMRRPVVYAAPVVYYGR